MMPDSVDLFIGERRSSISMVGVKFHLVSNFFKECPVTNRKRPSKSVQTIVRNIFPPPLPPPRSFLNYRFANGAHARGLVIPF